MSQSPSVWRHPAARSLLLARGVSDLGDFLGLGAVMVFSYEAAGTLAAPGAAFAVQALPALLVGLLGARMLDRIHPRTGMVATALAAGAIALVMAVAPTLPVLYVGLAMLGAARAVVGPLRFAAMRSSVPEDLRQPLLGLSSTSYQASQVIGFVAGGALAALLGPVLALALDAATFLLAAMLLVRAPIRRPEVVDTDGAPRGGAIDGLRTVARQPVLALLAPIVWLGFLASALPETVAAAVGDGVATGLLMAAAPLGGALAGYWASRHSGWDDVMVGRIAVIHGVSLLVVAAAVATGGSPLVVGVAFALHGGTSVYTVGAQRRFVDLPPADRVAGVNAAMQSTVIALEGIGALVLGALASRYGVAVPFALLGAVATAVSGLALVRFSAAGRRATTATA